MGLGSVGRGRVTGINWVWGFGARFGVLELGTSSHYHGARGCSSCPSSMVVVHGCHLGSWHCGSEGWVLGDVAASSPLCRGRGNFSALCFVS